MLSATQIAEFFEQFGLLSLLVLSFVYIVKNFESMFKSWTLLRTSRIAAIRQALDLSVDNEQLQQCYKAELEAEQFRLVSGMSTTSEYRQSILDLLIKSEGKLTLGMIKKSQEFRDLSCLQVSVNLKKRDRVWGKFAYSVGVFSFLMLIVSMVLLVYELAVDPQAVNLRIYVTNIIMFTFSACFFMKEVLAYNNAKIVKDILDEVN